MASPDPKVIIVPTAVRNPGVIQTPRNLLMENSWQNLAMRAASTPADADGIYRDAGTFQIGIKKYDNPITITNITNGNPAVATFTGSIETDNPKMGYTLGEITSGMTEMSGRLIRPTNVSGSTFQVYQDGDDTGYVNNDNWTGATAVNATGYGSWTGSVQAQAYRRISTADRGAGGHFAVNSDDYPYMRIVQGSFTPPDTLNGSANPISPLEGTQFLSSNIAYWVDHSREISGSINANGNRPRWQVKFGTTAQGIVNQETMWLGVNYAVPSNFDLVSGETVSDFTQTQVLDIEQNTPIISGGSGNLLTLHISKLSGSFKWAMDANLSGNSTSGTVSDNILGTVSDDLGLWTTFIFKVRSHPTNGILEVWKSTGGYTTGQQRAMTKVYSRVNQPVGFTPDTGRWFILLKQYKFDWHRRPNTINSENIWLGVHGPLWGSEQSHSTTYNDVHPFRLDEP